MKFLDENKKEITDLLGHKQYELKRNYIRQIAKEEEKKGNFLAVEGDIDNRSQDKIDATL